MYIHSILTDNIVALHRNYEVWIIKRKFVCELNYDKWFMYVLYFFNFLMLYIYFIDISRFVPA